jgi:hypothetical protein
MMIKTNAEKFGTTEDSSSMTNHPLSILDLYQKAVRHSTADRVGNQ